MTDSNMNYARKNFGCSFDSNMSRIFVFGGDISSNASTSTIEQYTLEYDEWELLKKIYTDSPTISPTPEPTSANYSLFSTTTATTATTTELESSTTSTTQSVEPTPIKLSFKRTKHNCILGNNTSKIFIFGGGGCSDIDNVCTDFRNLVEIFDTETFDVSTDDPLLYSAISDSYSSLAWRYQSKSSKSKQLGSWFDGIFVIGGNTENVNATYMVQYRVTDFAIYNNSKWSWQPDTVSYLIFIMLGILLLIIFAGHIFKRVKHYSDARLISVLFWFLYLMDMVFDFAFNGHLWTKGKFGLAGFGLFFIILRLVYNIGFTLRMELRSWKRDITIRERVQEYLLLYMSPCCQFPDSEWFIYLLALLSGSSHGLIHLVNSNLFGLSIFNMGLVKRHMIEYNLTRLPSGLICGNIPQLIIQLLYVLEWGSEDTTVLYAALTTIISLFFGVLDIFVYRNSTVPVRKLMLDEDFTKPYFIIIKSKEMAKIGHDVIHKTDELIDCLSQMIDVMPQFIEINLHQVLPKTGIKISFVEYSGTKNPSEIMNALNTSIQQEWFPKTMKTYWKLNEEPIIEIWDEQSMMEHRQLLTEDLIVNMKTLYQQYGEDTCCNRCYKMFCVCSCCYECCDTLKVSSSMRQ